MSICLTKFPFGGLGEPNIYHDSGVFYKEGGFWFERVCEGYKYLHLTGLWLGMMDRDNATDRDRNVYSIPHPSSPFFYS